MPELPKLEMPKIEMPKMPWDNSWMEDVRQDQETARSGGQQGGTVYNADAFRDTDGDTISLKRTTSKRVDFYVNGQLKITAAALEQKGQSLELQGIDAQDWKYKFSPSFKTYLTDLTTPADPADLEKAVALVS